MEVRKASPVVMIAQTIRASLLANATATTLAGTLGALCPRIFLRRLPLPPGLLKLLQAVVFVKLSLSVSVCSYCFA